MTKIIKTSLCAARHQMPADVVGSVFGNTLDPLDINGLQKTADDFVGSLDKDASLHLYVTGLTVALVAVINACKKAGVKLVLWHFNRDNGDYYPQDVA